MPLTDLKIKNLKAKDKAYRAYDSEGLYIQVSPSGGKLWRWLGHRDSALRLFQDLQYLMFVKSARLHRNSSLYPLREFSTFKHS